MECIRINFTKTHVNPFLAQCSITKPSANVKKNSLWFPDVFRGYIRLEQSDFFSQWTRGKTKIRLEKPAVNISNPTGGKNEKARRGALHERLRLDLYFG